MASRSNSDEDEDLALALALSLSRLSPNIHDEHATQLLPGGSALANPVSRPTTPPSDEEDYLALAMRLLQLSSDDFDELVAGLHRTGSAPASENARSSTPPNESDEDDLELALKLSQLPADIYDEQAKELNRRRVDRTGVEDSLASRRSAPVEVRMIALLHLSESLKIVLGRHAKCIGYPTRLRLGLGRRAIGPA
jgi:hypothetical protein